MLFRVVNMAVAVHGHIAIKVKIGRQKRIIGTAIPNDGSTLRCFNRAVHGFIAASYLSAMCSAKDAPSTSHPHEHVDVLALWCSTRMATNIMRE